MNTLPAWANMWLLCALLYAAAKALAFRRAGVAAQQAAGWRVGAFLLLWPGMNGAKFLDAREAAARPPAHEWWLALGKTVLGMLLTWGVARWFAPEHPLAAGWTGMVGLIFLLHFGTFHLISLAWRSAGVEAPPLMLAPHRAVSVSEFWARRWNRAFYALVLHEVFLPLARRWGPVPAVWTGFLFSGLIHDLVVSFPAQAGYGLPTLYFLIQAAAVTLERTRVATVLGMGGGARGWTFTMFFVTAPVGLLFHRPFIEKVMLPFLAAIRAI